jgi:hypothetical protein
LALALSERNKMRRKTRTRSGPRSKLQIFKQTVTLVCPD